MARYWAFISYSTHDARTARELADRLQRARVPASKRSTVDSSGSRLQPLYLDDRAASARSSLNAELQAALRASHALIVVCSPFAVASKHVSEEVRYFQSLGNGRPILAMVASGVPNASDKGEPALECFPEPLRSKRGADGGPIPIPLGDRPLAPRLGDARPADWRRVVRQITAGVLDLSPADLARTRFIRRITLSAVSVVLVAAAILVAREYWIPSEQYAARFVRVNGEWVPVDKIDANAARHLPQHYEFVSHGLRGKADIVRFRDSHGQCPNDGMPNLLEELLTDECSWARACEAHLKYGSNGEIVEEALQSQYGDVLESFRYTGSSTGLFTEGGFDCSRSRSGIRYVKFERYADGANAGRDKRRHFLGRAIDGEHHARVSPAGAYGYEYSYDVDGRVTTTKLLSSGGGAQVGRSGYAQIAWAYDARGNQISQSYFGPLGKPVIASDGTAGWHADYDSIGRMTSKTSVDLNGQPIPSAAGYVTSRYKYFDDGQIEEAAYYDAQGNPASIRAGYSVVRFGYDKKGGEIFHHFLDTKLSPTLTDGLEAGEQIAYSDDRRVIDVTPLGVDGKPRYAAEGFATVRSHHDQHGRMVYRQYLGLAQEPIFVPDGVSAYRAFFNDKGQKIRTEGYDVSGKRTQSKDGASGQKYSFDDNGNVVSTENIGVDGESFADNDGVARIMSSFNDDGQEIERRYLGIDGQLLASHLAVRLAFDELGRGVFAQYVDAQDRPAVNKRGWSSMKSKYDDKGRVVEVSYFDPAGRPAQNGSYGAIIRNKYNRVGALLEESFFGIDGKPFLVDNAAVRVYERDSLGRETSVRYFGRSNERASSGAGIWGYDSAYDQAGRLEEIRYVDLRGVRVVDSSGAGGWRKKYDQSGHVAEEVNLDAEGKPANRKDGVCRTSFQYDERGRVVRRSFFDANGNPVRDPATKSATILTAYDERSREAEVRYLDAKGEPIVENLSMLRNVYDSRGYVQQVFWFEGDKAAEKFAPARAVYQRDSFGRETRREFFDATGKRFVSRTSGRAIVEFEWDKQGRVTRERSFGMHAEPVNRLDSGWHERRVSYSEDKDAPSVVCTDTSGRPVKKCSLPDQD